MAMDKEKGIVLAYLTAIVSGISVFANSFGVLTLEPVAYTFVKNLLVAAILAAIALSAGNWKEILSINRKQLLMLFFIGVIGGGVAFALFFTGLSQVSGAYGSFIYRLLFLFAAAIGIVILKERPGWQTAAGTILLLAGNAVLLGSENMALSSGALMVLCATVLWAAEYAVSKKALEGLSATTVASARMGIGAMVLLGLLVAQGKAGALLSISSASFVWIAIATGLLAMFTTLWYSALKSTTLTAATAAFALGGPISSFLSFAFAGKALALAQAGGLLLLAAGAVFVVGAGQTLLAANWLKGKALAVLRA